LSQYVLDTCLAVIGILMFGDGISDAITTDVLATKGYPQALTILMCIFVAIIPLTKMPLNARPLVTTAEVLLGLHEFGHHHYNHVERSRRAVFLRSIARASIRVVNVVILLLISIAFPAFDSVCAFLGAALCTLISVVLPISFYLKLFWHDVPPRERALAMAILVLFSIFGLVGTVWTFLPKSLIGA
jgi:vesicular inhibitory amino acid transporter